MSQQNYKREVETVRLANIANGYKAESSQINVLRKIIADYSSNNNVASSKFTVKKFVCVEYSHNIAWV